MSMSPVSNSSDKELVFYPNKIVTFGISIISFVFSAFSFSAGFPYPGEGPFNVNNLLWWPAIILFFSFGTFVWSVYLIITNKPLLILTKQGIYTPSFGNISWNEIKNFEVIISYTPEPIDAVSITLTDGSTCKINMFLLPVGASDLVEILKKY